MHRCIGQDALKVHCRKIFLALICIYVHGIMSALLHSCIGALVMMHQKCISKNFFLYSSAYMRVVVWVHYCIVAPMHRPKCTKSALLNFFFAFAYICIYVYGRMGALLLLLQRCIGQNALKVHLQKNFFYAFADICM